MDVRSGFTAVVRDIIERLKQAGRRVWLVLNKIDLVRSDVL